MSVQIAIRHYFSLNHLATASMMARRCKELETVHGGEAKWPESNHANQACAISALISSVAFLEATVNEVFCDCIERTSPHGIAFPNQELLASLWAQGVPRTASFSVLEKYQIALALAGKPKMPSDANPVQDVAILLFARNFLIHFEPEFVNSVTVSEAAKRQKIHAKLAGKFELNRLAPSNCLFFPDKALGAGCAEWAVCSALALTDLFFESCGVPATYSHLRGQPPYSHFQRGT